MRTRYELHGLRLDVEAAGPALAAVVDNILWPHRAPPDAPNGFSLRLEYAESAPPRRQCPAANEWNGVLPGGVAISFRFGELWRQIDLPELAWADLELPSGPAVVRLRAGQEWCLVEGCLLPLLCELLAQAKQYVVHAASLFVTAGSARRAVIVCGSSGAGKTSTALHLTRERMSLMADDATFVSAPPDGQPPRVWGLPVQCKVLANTLGLLPWLRDCPRRTGRVAGEFVVDPRDLPFEHRAITAEPGLILLLEPRNEHRHELRPVEKLVTLERLTRENVRAYEGKAQGRGGRTFQALGDLVRCSRTYFLSTCPRLDGLGEQIRALLEA